MLRKKGIDLQEDQVRKLLRSPEVAGDLRRRLNAMAAAAGPGMTVTVTVGNTRARGRIVTTTWEARAAEARNRALTRAIDRGRA